MTAFCCWWSKEVFSPAQTTLGVCHHMSFLETDGIVSWQVSVCAALVNWLNWQRWLYSTGKPSHWLTADTILIWETSLPLCSALHRGAAIDLVPARRCHTFVDTIIKASACFAYAQQSVLYNSVLPVSPSKTRLNVGNFPWEPWGFPGLHFENYRRKTCRIDAMFFCT